MEYFKLFSISAVCFFLSLSLYSNEKDLKLYADDSVIYLHVIFVLTLPPGFLFQDSQKHMSKNLECISNIQFRLNKYHLAVGTLFCLKK